MLADKLIEHKLEQYKAEEEAAEKTGVRTKPKWVSVAKSVSWRMVGTIDTMVISYFITGELTMAISIGSVEVFSKMVLYYFHERIWEKFTSKF
ncbi:DUF2061 domain-containing protein [Flammeovirga agarivorans]|uniref:DUF2061 domain-containing protein n=1 Tax=Flammeovirga agarivorans TaxID=2726742 RepID=A0A7X8XX04_9BACT|nr:DUF2061 domain-containing protein [Flammeovirga agarivorans]NLR92600.1 DUF2061 domain-containing protein [Flammeovirga agarivorans]